MSGTLPGSFIYPKLRELYYERGDWSDSTVFDFFQNVVEEQPKKIAVVDKRGQISYADLYNKVIQISNGMLKHNIKKGDIISVQLPNWVENVIVYLACTRLGAVYNPVPVTMRKQELHYILSLCEPKMLFIPEHFRNQDYVEMVAELQKEVDIPAVVIVNNKQSYPSLNPSHLLFEDIAVGTLPVKLQEKVHGNDSLVVLFTSGTESMPKGVIHTHNTVLYTERSLINALSITENDRVFMASPISHATGFYHGVNLPLFIGAKCVLMEQFSAEGALKIISEENCTFSMGATPFLYDLVKEMNVNSKNYNLSHFRFFLCGGAPIPKHLSKKANQIGIKVLPVYGTSESSPHVVGRLEDEEDMNTSYDGKLLPGIEVKIVDEQRNPLPNGLVGEEASRGPNVFIGYYKRPDLTEMYFDHEGWFYSGDLCVLEDEYLRVVGRKKDIIIRGGQNISPSEIEEILLMHPKIEKAAVFGMPDPRLGERAHTVVVLREGEELSFEEMISFIEKQGIAKYKYPEFLHLIKEMPTTASGKIQKFKLYEMLKKSGSFQVK